MDRFVIARGWLGAAALACALVPAQAQPGPLVKHTEGTLAVAPPGDREWVEVRPGRPVHHGERLWTDRGSRAELQVAGHALRTGGETQLSFDAVAPGATRISVRRGSVVARVGPLRPNENFELDTPNLALRAVEPGLYRIDVDLKGANTRVTVLEGFARLYGERGERWEVKPGQRVSFRGRNLALASAPAKPDSDDLDRWVAARESRSVPAAPQVAAATAAKPAAVKPVAAGTAIPAANPAATARAPARAAPRSTATARARPATTPSRPAMARGDAGRPVPRADAERYDHDQDSWLRYNHGLPPLPRPAPMAIPARRVG